MLIVDRLLVGGIRFVLDKVASAVETEMNDVDRLREELLASQMRFELGEIDAAELQRIELTLLPQIREINERQRREAEANPEAEGGGDYRVAGIEAEFLGEPTGLGEVAEPPTVGTPPAQASVGGAPASRRGRRVRR